MDQPTNIPRYIKIVTQEPLEKTALSAWYGFLKQNLPNGVLTQVMVNDNTGIPRAVFVVQRNLGGKNEYIVPLLRDLSDAEVDPSVSFMAERFPELSFDVEVSSAETDSLTNQPKIELPDESYTNLCMAWAKKKHENWMKDRVDNGWRYGITMSTKDKTHPLLRPWHELPDAHRTVDTEQPQQLIDLLADHGYVMVSKDELDALKSKARRV